MLVTVLVGFGSILNLREKLFVAFSCMAKASVQVIMNNTLKKLIPKFRLFLPNKCLENPKISIEFPPVGP